MIIEINESDYTDIILWLAELSNILAITGNDSESGVIYEKIRYLQTLSNSQEYYKNLKKLAEPIRQKYKEASEK